MKEISNVSSDKQWEYEKEKEQREFEKAKLEADKVQIAAVEQDKQREFEKEKQIKQLEYETQKDTLSEQDSSENTKRKSKLMSIRWQKKSRIMKNVSISVRWQIVLDR